MSRTSHIPAPLALPRAPRAPAALLASVGGASPRDRTDESRRVVPLPRWWGPPMAPTVATLSVSRRVPAPPRLFVQFSFDAYPRHLCASSVCCGRARARTHGPALRSSRARVCSAQEVVARCVPLVLKARARGWHGRRALQTGRGRQVEVQMVVGSCDQRSQPARLRRQVECGEEDARCPGEGPPAPDWEAPAAGGAGARLAEPSLSKGFSLGGW